MEKLHVPNDDILDIAEMTEKLENFIDTLFHENDHNLVISALMSSFINSVLMRCDTSNSALFHRDVFMNVFDDSIRWIKIKEK